MNTTHDAGRKTAHRPAEGRNETLWYDKPPIKT
jgi:hypothetical protein